MPRPLIQRWTAYRADQGRGDPITQPPGTHQHYPDRVVAWVDEHAYLDTSQFPALVQAAQQTPRGLLTLIGPHEQTTRVYRALHRWLDDTMPKQLRTPKKRSAARPSTYARCGETSPRTGHPCGAAAGWGTDHVGEGPCYHHGGSVEMKEAARELVREEMGVLQRLAEKAATGEPITLQDRLNGAIAVLAGPCRAWRCPARAWRDNHHPRLRLRRGRAAGGMGPPGGRARSCSVSSAGR